MNPLISHAALIMYDLDGTLVESVPDLAMALDKTLADLHLPAAGADKTRLWVGNGIPTLVKRALADAQQPEAGILLEQAIERFRHHYQQVLGAESYLYPGVSRFLQAMQACGVKQSIITNKSEAFTEQLLKLMGINHYFDLVLGGDSLSEKKPHPMPLLHTLKALDIAPNKAVMVGDSVNDVRAARAAGIAVIGLPYGYNHGNPIETANPDAVVSSLTELL